MSQRTVYVCGAALTGLLTSTPATGQSWTAPRNAFGQPDLEGVWLSNAATPLERPKALEGRDRLTDAEVAEFKQRAARLFAEDGGGDFAVGDGIFQALLTNPTRYTNPNATHGSEGMVDLMFDNRTSLVINRPDGRLPAVTPEGRRRQQAVAAAFQRPQAPADVGGALRCLSWGVPGSAAGTARAISATTRSCRRRSRGPVCRDRPRGARHPARRAPARERWPDAVERRLARPMGRGHAGGRDATLLDRRASSWARPNA